MNMTFKNKLYLGLGILTLLILLLWISSLIFFNNLANSSSDIIQGNVRSIVYMENIQQNMKKFYLLQTSILSKSEPALAPPLLKIDSLRSRMLSQSAKELQNITEPKEEKVARSLRGAMLVYLDQFDQLMYQTDFKPKAYHAITQQYALVQRLLGKVISVNVKGMAQKNEHTQNTASKVISYMMIIGIISILLAIVLLIGYPNYIVKLIDEVIAGTNKIAKHNFRPRLRIEKGSEFEELATAFNTMAASLQEYEASNIAKLKNEKQRVEVIINHIFDAVIGLDKDKNILFINAKAEELIGLKYEHIVGHYAPDIAAGNDLVRMLIRNSMNGEKKTNRQAENRDHFEFVSGDKKIYYSKEIIPVMSASNGSNYKRQIGFIIILKNVTHFHEMDEAKTNFIAVASHELKTPISSINMSLRLLKDERVGQLNDEQKNLVSNIEDDAERMKKSTRNLLDLSKIETGNVHVNLQQADPLMLMKRAYETMLVQVQQKEVSIRIESDDELPKVKADIQKTVWVLVNLIANAIRYTPSKGLIKLSAAKMNGKVKFTVIDTGKGILPEYQDKIFDKYFQVYNNRNGDESSGLGLAIAKEFINAQGGEIGVESEMGKGSCFYFTLSIDKI
jgi:PAS domain S-box-containing protein